MGHSAEKDATGDPLFAGVPDDNLRAAAEGCTELTCLYHGRINAELRRRARITSPAVTEAG